MKRSILCCALTFCSAVMVFSQSDFWQSTDGPYNSRSVFQQIGAGPGGVLYGLDGVFENLGRRLIRSDDGGLNWFEIDGTNPSIPHSFERIAVASDGTLYGLSNNRTLYRSTDQGMHWTNVTPPKISLPNLPGFAFTLDPQDRIFAWNGTFRMYASTDRGGSWAAHFIPLHGGGDISSLTFANNNLTIATKTNGQVMASADGGSTWRAFGMRTVKGLRLSRRTLEFLYQPSTHILFALARMPYDPRKSALLQSSDNGAHWSIAIVDTTGGKPSVAFENLAFASPSGSQDLLFIGGTYPQYDIVRLSSLGGQRWAASIAHPIQTTDHVIYVYPNQVLETADRSLLVGTTGSGIQRSTDQGASWNFANMHVGAAVRTISVAPGGDVFALGGADESWMSRSTDGGLTWNRTGEFPEVNGHKAFYLRNPSFRPDGSIIVSAYTSDMVYKTIICKSTDNGASWSVIGNPNPVEASQFLGVNKQGDLFIYLDAFEARILRSSDDGASWQTVYQPGRSFLSGMTMTASGELFLANGSYDGGIYHSTDDGQTWDQIAVYDSVIGRAMPVDRVSVTVDGTLFANNFYLYRSTDHGISWSRLNERTSLVNSTREICSTPNGDVFVSASYTGVCRSTDNGDTWSRVNSGLLDSTVAAFALTGDGHLLAGTSYHGVERTRDPLAGPSPKAEVKTNSLPTVFALHQNYPNPFNPSTTIAFDLPNAAMVTLAVYNILGQEVATLLSAEFMDNGEQDVQFNASNLPSGVYYYRITAENSASHEIVYSAVKKLMLVK